MKYNNTILSLLTGVLKMMNKPNKDIIITDKTILDKKTWLINLIILLIFLLLL